MFNFSFLRRRFRTSVAGEAPGLFIALLCSVLLSLSLSGYSRIRIPHYSQGDIAKASVVVPADILIMDEPATEARKAAARAAVLPIYRYDPSSQLSLIAQVSQVFDASRQILSPEISRRDLSFRRLPPRMRAALEAELALIPSQPDEELLDYFVREHFDQSLEDSLVSVLRQSLAWKLITDERSLTGRAGRIEVIDLSNGKKQVLSVTEPLTLDEARQRVRELVNKGSKASTHINRIIADWMGSILAANLHYDLQATEAKQTEAANSVDPVLRQLKRGKVIVRQGDEISEDQLRQMEAVRKFTPNLRSVPRFLGTNLLILSLLLILWVILRSVSLRQWSRTKLLAFGFVTLLANVILVKALWIACQTLSGSFVASPFNDEKFFFFALPFAFGSMLVTLLVDEHFAQLYLIFYIPLAGQVTGTDFQGFLYIGVVNLLGILLIRKARQRMSIVNTGFTLSAAAAFLFVAVELARQGPWNLGIGAFGAGMALLSGPINASLVTFALPLCERLLLVTTEIRLSELGNLNLPLLRKLVLSAPGTYNHSIAVGTLAEGAANAIGLNPLFVRVASLYHDIGKSLQPEFFVENQTDGINPHDLLEPLESVRIVREHVSAGIRLAGDAKLPPAIVDAIPQHHGTKLLSYFYDKARKAAGTDASGIREADYRYPGPKPQSKEAAVIMLADAVESAARTLPEHSEEQLLSLIEKIISTTMADGQLAETNLTLSDIDHIKFSFLETLLGFYHNRIAYPSFDFGAKAAPSGR